MRSGVFTDYKIFTGNSHPELAREIADIMGKPLGKANVTDSQMFTARFP